MVTPSDGFKPTQSFNELTGTNIAKEKLPDAIKNLTASQRKYLQTILKGEKPADQSKLTEIKASLEAGVDKSEQARGLLKVKNFFQKIPGGKDSGSKALANKIIENDKMVANSKEVTEAERNEAFREIESDKNAFSKLRKELRGDLEVATRAVQKNWEMLEFVSEDLKNDPLLVLVALNESAAAIQYAGPELRNKEKWMLGQIKKDPKCVIFSGDELKKNNEFRQKAKAIRGVTEVIARVKRENKGQSLRAGFEEW